MRISVTNTLIIAIGVAAFVIDGCTQPKPAPIATPTPRAVPKIAKRAWPKGTPLPPMICYTDAQHPDDKWCFTQGEPR